MPLGSVIWSKSLEHVAPEDTICDPQRL